MDERIVTGLDKVVPGPSVVSIGFFDGVHRGHQAIVRRAVRVAEQCGRRSVVVTFDRHPMEVVDPGSQPKLLMTLARRAGTLAAQHVDQVVVLPFDDVVRHWSPEEFVAQVLDGPLQAERVVVGGNFRFGHRAAGDVSTLADLGAARGFSVEGVTLLEVDGVVVSSTEIRGCIDEGDVERAAVMLGRPHLVDGIVVRGDQRGVTLGFPTANLQVSKRVAVPAQGVYAGHLRMADGTRLPAVTNVGTNPTFGGQELRIEAHVIDWEGDLYGMEVAVEFSHRLREERKFSGVDPLIAQINADVESARRILYA